MHVRLRVSAVGNGATRVRCPKTFLQHRATWRTIGTFFFTSAVVFLCEVRHCVNFSAGVPLLSLSLSLSLSVSVSLCVCLSLSRARALSLSLSHTHIHMRAHALTLIFSIVIGFDIMNMNQFRIQWRIHAIINNTTTTITTTTTTVKKQHRGFSCMLVFAPWRAGPSVVRRSRLQTLLGR